MGLLNFRRKQTDVMAAGALNDPFSAEPSPPAGDPFEQPPAPAQPRPVARPMPPVQPMPPSVPVAPIIPAPVPSQDVQRPVSFEASPEQPVSPSVPASPILSQDVQQLASFEPFPQPLEDDSMAQPLPEQQAVAQPLMESQYIPLDYSIPATDEGVEQAPPPPAGDPFEQPLVQEALQEPQFADGLAEQPSPEEYSPVPSRPEMDFQVPEVLMHEEPQFAEDPAPAVMPDTAPVEDLVVMHDEKRTDIYVEKRQYQQVLLMVSDVQDDIREAMDHLTRVLDDENIVSSQVDSWHDLLNDIQENLIAIDMRLFEKGDSDG